MSTAVAVPAASVLGVWHAAEALAAGYKSHLLTASWQARRGGARPSLCGQWRQVWRPVEEFAAPDRFLPCTTCRALAADGAPSAPAVAPVPTPAVEPVVPVVVAPAVAPDEVAPRRVVPAAAGAQKVWHLLHAQPRRKAHTTLAVCGEPRIRWVDAPTDGTCRPCRACAGLGPDVPLPPPVRIAPTVARRAGPDPRVATAAMRALPLDPQHATAALPDRWRARRGLRLPFGRDLDGNRVWRTVDDGGGYIPRSHEIRRDHHVRTSGGIAFPPWTRLTVCHPSNGERADATHAPTR